MSNEKERQNKREKGVLLPEGVVVDGNNMEPLETQWKVAFAGVERSALGLRQGPARQPTGQRIHSLVLRVG